MYTVSPMQTIQTAAQQQERKDSDKHFENFISTNTKTEALHKTFVIYLNKAMGYLESLLRTYCIHMYGCKSWDQNCKYVSEFKVAWRKIKRPILVGLPYKSHIASIHL